MSKYKVGLVALVLVIAAVTLFLVLAPGMRPAAPQPTEATGLTLRGYEGGSLTWQATADRGEVSSATGKLSGVTLRAFDGTATTLDVTARELEQRQGALQLVGDVRGATPDGLAISADSMTWRSAERRLESGQTWIEWRNDQLTADQFAYDARLEEAYLTTVRGTLARERLVAFSSDQGQASRSRILLRGHVVASSDKDTVSADELEADFDAQIVTLRGDVEASGPQFELHADSFLLAPEGRTAQGHVSADVLVSPEGVANGA